MWGLRCMYGHLTTKPKFLHCVNSLHPDWPYYDDVRLIRIRLARSPLKRMLIISSAAHDRSFLAGFASRRERRSELSSGTKTLRHLQQSVCSKAGLVLALLALFIYHPLPSSHSPHIETTSKRACIESIVVVMS